MYNIKCMIRICELVINDNNKLIIVKNLDKDEWRFHIREEMEKNEEFVSNSYDYLMLMCFDLIDRNIKVSAKDNDTLIEGRFFRYSKYSNKIIPEYRCYKRVISLDNIIDIKLDSPS